jgi:MFS family permease
MPVTTFSAFRHRNFRLFYTGQSLSVVGMWMHGIAQGWLVLELTDSAFYVGLVSALTKVPIMLLSFYAGVVADRMEKRRLIMICQTVAMGLTFTLSWLAFSGLAQVWHVMVVTVLVGVVFAFEIPARQAFIIDLVGKEDLTNAVALNSSSFNASRIVGPAIAGILITSFGVAICFFINAVSFLFSLIALAMLRLSPREQRPREGSAWFEMKEGLSFVRKDPTISPLIFLISMLALFAFPYEVLLPVFARDVMQYGAREYGWMVSAAGVGALVGALGLATVASRVSRGRLVVTSSMVFGASIVLLSFTRSVALAVAVLVGAGFAMILTTSTTNTLLQTLSPDKYRGRVMSAYTWAFLGVSPIGALLSGWIAEAFGVPVALAVGGVVVMIVSGWLALTSKNLLAMR